MQLELEKLKGDASKTGSDASGSSRDVYATKTAAKSQPKPPKKTVTPAPGEGPPPETEAAKMARLRRICERKPSGKIYCDASLHEQWKNGTKEDREALVEILERCNWQKAFLYVNKFHSWNSILFFETLMVTLNYTTFLL